MKRILHRVLFRTHKKRVIVYETTHWNLIMIARRLRLKWGQLVMKVLITLGWRIHRNEEPEIDEGR